MEIPVNKNSLAGALSALGKLVSRTSLIKAYQGIEIEGKANMLCFKTRNVIEQIEFRLFADLEDDFPAILVEFEQFRQLVRGCKNKTLKLEVDCREIFIGDEMLTPIKGHFPPKDVLSFFQKNIDPGQKPQNIKDRHRHVHPHEMQTRRHGQDGAGKAGDPLYDIGTEDHQTK